jgi:transposase InsO family protein
MPGELQQQVDAVVQQTRRRSGWSARRTLRVLGVSPTSFYRWKRGAALRAGGGLFGPPPRLLTQPYEALQSERNTVRRYALAHPELRHRELAWRMVDEDVAYLSPSTVYRILQRENLVCPWRRRTKRKRPQAERAQRPNERWATDLRYVWVGSRFYYLVTFTDEYSRYIVYHELLANMQAHSVSLAAQAALETIGRRRDNDGKIVLGASPEIRSDNGSAYVSREFAEVLAEHGLTHRRIHPHCPEENGLAERVQRTLGEAFEDEEFHDWPTAQASIDRIVRRYNHERLHSALGFLRPVNYYRGHPQVMHNERRRKLAVARHQRKETNLGLRQRTLLLETGKEDTSCSTPEPLLNQNPKLCHYG